MESIRRKSWNNIELKPNQCNQPHLRLAPRSKVLFDRLDHLIAHPGRLWESRGEIGLNLLELFSVAVHVAERDLFRPVLSSLASPDIAPDRTDTYSCRKRKLEIIRSEGVVVDGRRDDFVEQFLVAEEVLGDTKPQTEKLQSHQYG